MSPEAFPGTPLTPSLAAYLAYHKYELGVPFHRLERHFSGTLGIPMSKQCMAGWMAMAAERLGPVYDRMKSDLLATPAKAIHADGTTLTLSKRADPSRRKSYVFVYASSFYDERQIHIYEFNETREIDPESSFLRDFAGWVECDDYAGYDRLRKSRPKVRLQRCWAHARRKFADIVKGMPQKARPKSVAFAVMSEMGRLFEIKGKAHEDRLFGRELLDVREREERPIIGRIRALVFETEAKKGSTLEGALNYVRKVWDDLLPYLSEPCLELSNNLAERCVKPFVVARKVFQNLGQRGRGQIHGHALLDNPHGDHQRAGPIPIPRIRAGERRKETGRGHRSVFERPRNPLISTKTGFNHQAPNLAFLWTGVNQ